VNGKLYIHEFVDIIGQNRAKYMYHMTANFSPLAQQDRNQLCYGVWGVLGSTGRWPEVVNIWELDGFDGAVPYFRHELNDPTMQDPKMARWWAQAAPLRSGGNDRLLVPAPWTRTITELCADGVRGEIYAHEQIGVRAGASADYLELLRERGRALRSRYGWELSGAWETAMVDDSECFALWAIPTWEQWAEFEKAQRTDDDIVAFRRQARELTTAVTRILLVDAPFCPFKIGRQPHRSDRTEPWDES
jgi:hypothetical protein